jgi:hypothetical protein
MKPSTELFDLIKSLTKSEKRFFKLNSSLQSGDKNYLKIFDAIDKQQTYDEEAIKKMFRKETFIKHLPSEKNHLYKLILKSLRLFHGDNSISSILKQEIKNIEILYKKALYKECNKFLIRAKKLAEEHEKFYYLFELISIEKLLLEEAFESGDFDRSLDDLIEEEQDVIGKLRNLASYHMLYSKVNSYFRTGGFVRNEEAKKAIKEISEHPLIVGKNTALSVRATTICYYIKGFCANANMNRKESFGHYMKVKEILDENPMIRKDLGRRYIRTLSYLIYGYMDNNDYESAKRQIEEIKNLPKAAGFNTLDFEIIIFVFTSIAETFIEKRIGDKDSILKAVENITEGLDKYGEKINKEQRIVLYYNVSYAYFLLQEYNKSLQWINMVLNDNERILRQDIYSFSRLFNLIIHFELKNFDLLEYIIKSTYRYLHKRERDFKAETIFIKYIKKFTKTNSELELKDTFVQFKEEINEAFKDPQEKVVLQYFHVNAWVESHLSQKTMLESFQSVFRKK